MMNLDYLCIKYAQEFPRTDANEKLLRKALGVLKEDGVYALFVWIGVKDKENIVNNTIIDLLNEDVIRRRLFDSTEVFSKDFNEFFKKLKDVTEDIYNLFFLKKIIERTLIYAIYHCRTG